MKIYTKTGDAGTTSLVGGTRVAKTHPRLEAYGTVDELNASIGLLIAMGGIPEATVEMLRRIQNLLFNLGSELATEPDSKWKPHGITAENITMIEREIDAMDAQLPVHHQFILPGGSMAAAQAHVARTIARRAERRMIAMNEAGSKVSDEAFRFINRLSDYLFVISRQINIFAGESEIFWDKTC